MQLGEFCVPAAVKTDSASGQGRRSGSRGTVEMAPPSASKTISI